MAWKQLQGCYVHSGRGDKEEEVFCSQNTADIVNKASVSFVIFFLTTSVNLSLQNTLNYTMETGGCI